MDRARKSRPAALAECGWPDGYIKTANGNGLFAKSRYDGAGRLVSSYTSFDADESSYGEADDVTGDTVIEQSTTIYDKGGRPVVNQFFQRFHDDTTSTGELTADASYASGNVNCEGHGVGRTRGRICTLDKGDGHHCREPMLKVAR